MAVRTAPRPSTADTKEARHKRWRFRTPSRMAASTRLGYTFLAIPALYVTVVVLGPLVFNVYASLQSWNFLGDEPSFGGLTNYEAVFTDPRWLSSLWRTLAFTALAVSIEMVIGFSLALLLHRKFHNLRWLQAIFLMPMMISEVAAALSWRLLLTGDNSLANWLVGLLGIPPQNWLGADWAFASIVAVDVWQQTPFVMLVVFAALQGVPEEPLEAAELDGAGMWARIRYIIVPYILPALAVILIFRTVFALRVFGTVWILTGGGPGDTTAVLGIEIYRVAFSSFNTGLGAALSMVMLVVSAVIAVFYARTLRREALS